jgi:hypothetical protein
LNSRVPPPKNWLLSARSFLSTSTLLCQSASKLLRAASTPNRGSEFWMAGSYAVRIAAGCWMTAPPSSRSTCERFERQVAVAGGFLVDHRQRRRLGVDSGAEALDRLLDVAVVDRGRLAHEVRQIALEQRLPGAHEAPRERRRGEQQTGIPDLGM